MARRDDQPKLTEPEIVHCLFCTGLDVEVAEHYVRIVGWVDLPVVGYDEAERRVVARLVLTGEAAARLARGLRPRRAHS